MLGPGEKNFNAVSHKPTRAPIQFNSICSRQLWFMGYGIKISSPGPRSDVTDHLVGMKDRHSLLMGSAAVFAAVSFVFFLVSFLNRATFVWPWKMVSVSVCYLFYQPMDGKNKTWTLRFPAKENPNMEKALFDWPIVLQYDVKAISRKFFGHEVCLPERSLNQPKARSVCIRSINQSNRSISVRLLFLFCSRVFISRSYENRSNHAFYK